MGEIARDIVTDDVRKKINLDKDLLAILCCPETKQVVVLADDALIQKMNSAIYLNEWLAGVGARATPATVERYTHSVKLFLAHLGDKAQKPVTEKLDGGLVRSDNQILYPIREDIPVMLIDEGIPLAQMS